MLQLRDARVAHGVSCAAVGHAAPHPLQRLVTHRASACVTHAAYERLLCWRAAAVGQGNEGVALGTLRRVVHHLGANAAVLVLPLRGEVDGARRPSSRWG